MPNYLILFFFFTKFHFIFDKSRWKFITSFLQTRHLRENTRSLSAFNYFSLHCSLYLIHFPLSLSLSLSSVRWSKIEPTMAISSLRVESSRRYMKFTITATTFAPQSPNSQIDPLFTGLLVDWSILHSIPDPIFSKIDSSSFVDWNDSSISSRAFNSESLEKCSKSHKSTVCSASASIFLDFK